MGCGLTVEARGTAGRRKMRSPGQMPGLEGNNIMQ